METIIKNGDRETTIQTRQMSLFDVSDVLTIEQDSFEKPWSKCDFDRLLNLLCRQHKSAGVVAEHDDQIIGFVMYEQRLGKLRMLNIAVADVFHRHSVGTHLVDTLIAQLCPGALRSIVVIVRETNDAAISFFCKLGFHGSKVLEGYYSDSEEAAYRLDWNLAGHREIAGEVGMFDGGKEAH